jgi:hypothetical protein
VQVRTAPLCGGGVDGGIVDGGTVDGGSGDGGPHCTPPLAPTGLKATPQPTSVTLSFASATSGTTTLAFEVRYSSQPITDANFDEAIPPSQMPPAPGIIGSTVTTSLTGLRSQQTYYVAVRAVNACQASPVVTASFTTLAAQFATLHGCFIATAAYGTPQARQIEVLRRFRDRQLLPTPLGRLAVATYYAMSPPLANAITTSEQLRAGARAIVQPLVDLAAAAEAAHRR